ncbi:MAG TPA: PAS domain S-box protein [Coriobacteriia bacterium]
MTTLAVGALDFRTIFAGYVLTAAVCAMVITSLWLRNRANSAGIGFWVANAWMQFVAVILTLLRGAVPDFVSLVVADTLVVGGLILLLMGLERYLDCVGSHRHNYALLAAFALFDTYFSVVHPSLQGRSTSASVVIAFVGLQAVWLLLRRVDPRMRADTRVASVVFGAYVAVSILRIGADLVVPAANDLLHPGLVETLQILAYGMLLISLTFTLVMMVNRRLLSSLERDIAERRLVEEALRRSEETFSVAFEHIPDAIILSSLASGRVMEVNQAFYEMTGLTRDQVLGRTTTELGVWADIADRGPFIEELEAQGTVSHFEATFRRSTGETFPGSVSAELIDVGGESALLAVVHDLTEAKRAGEALRESEQRLAQLAEQSGSFAWEVDALGLYTYVSDVTEAVVGYRPDELVGRMHFYDLHPEEGREPFKTAALAVFATKEPFVNLVNEAQAKDGRHVWLSTNGIPLLDSDGTLRGYRGSDTDITERKHAEEALRYAEARLRLLFEKDPDGIVILDPVTARPVEFNEAAHRQLGYTREEFARLSMSEIEVEETPEQTRAHIDAVIRDGRSDFETRHRTKEGEIRNVYVTAQTIEVAGQSVYHCSWRDVTDRAREHEQLSLALSVTDAVLESVDSGVLVVGIDGKTLRTNRKFAELWRIPDDVLASNGDAALLAHVAGELSDPEGFIDLVGRIYDDPDAEVFDEIRFKDGRTLERSSCPMTVDGVPAGRVWSFRDVTERTQAEDALRERNEFIETVLDNAPIGFAVNTIDDGQKVFVGRSFEQIYGVPLRSVNSVDDYFEQVYVDPEYREEMRQRIMADMASGDASRMRWEHVPITTRTGEFKVITAINLPILDQNIMVSTVQDVTEQWRAEEGLREAMQDLERSNKDLEQFAYVASHDLQEPLRMVASYTELLRERYQGRLDADADDFIGFAVDGAVRMQGLLEDLLEYARVGTRGREPEPVSSQAALDEALVNLGGRIQDTKAEIVISDLPVVMADETQLMRVFQNLIGNAIKFHRPNVAPRIDITAERSGDLWQFSAADNGIGIASGDLERVFEIFRRMHPRGRYPGTGIGLAVCRRIVERLGGSIWVESSGGAGTVFRFTLKAAP